MIVVICLFKQKSASELHISGWSSDLCSSDLRERCLLAALDPREALHVDREIARDASFGGRLPLCLVEHRHQRVERVFETGGGEIVLALEIISEDRKSTRLNSSH